MEASVSCNLKTTKCSQRHREIDGGPHKIPNSKHACIVDDHESTRKRVERTVSKDHEDHLAEKGFRLDICPLKNKNAELEPKYQKYKGQVVLRADNVKDDSGSYVVFTEQGSSASEKNVPQKVMGVIARLQGCAGQATNAVSAYTQVKMEDAPKSECPCILGTRLPRHKWPKS